MYRSDTELLAERRQLTITLSLGLGSAGATSVRAQLAEIDRELRHRAGFIEEAAVRAMREER